MFNRAGGPSAAQALDGATKAANVDESSASHRQERAELIGQATLLLGDGLQRGVAPHREAPQEKQASEPPPGLREGDRLEQLPTEPSERVVTVEVCAVPTRGGRPRSKTEVYPFGTIGLSRMIDGELRGESFVIPYDDHPLRRLAAARKRHKGKRFMTRKQDEGVRVWRSL